MSRSRWLIAAGIIAVVHIAVVLAVVPVIRYGSLRPCEMLRQDLRTAFRDAAGKMTSKPTDPVDEAARKLGAALATAVADPMIDQLAARQSAFGCARLVVKMKVDPEGALDDLAQPPR